MCSKSVFNIWSARFNSLRIPSPILATSQGSLRWVSAISAKQPYSKTDRTSPLNKINILLGCEPQEVPTMDYIKLILVLHLFTTYLVCAFHVSPRSNTTPRYLNSVEADKHMSTHGETRRRLSPLFRKKYHLRLRRTYGLAQIGQKNVNRIQRLL
jgi:hypothetical protein